MPTTHRTPNETFAGYTQLAVEVCCTCGVMFAMPDQLRQQCLGDHSRSFYCPNGHDMHFTGKSDFPEHEKLREVADVSQAIGEFIEWLPTVGIQLAIMDRKSWTDERLVPDSTSINDLLAAYFEIDQDKLESEKRAMLDALRAP